MFIEWPYAHTYTWYEQAYSYNYLVDQFKLSYINEKKTLTSKLFPYERESEPKGKWALSKKKVSKYPSYIRKERTICERCANKNGVESCLSHKKKLIRLRKRFISLPSNEQSIISNVHDKLLFNLRDSPTALPWFKCKKLSKG